MRDVAETAGVAMSSVSRVLSRHPDVSEEMRERVMVAVGRLGYSPDILAQSLRRRATMSIGFVAGDISNQLMASIVKGAEGEFYSRDYSMLLADSEGDAVRDAEHIRLFGQRRVDGLMLSVTSEDNPEMLAALADSNVPCVAVDRELPAATRANWVLSDHRSGMRDATTHLLELGHRRIGLILPGPMRPTRERLEGLREAYADRGLPETYVVVDNLLTLDKTRAAVRRLLDLDEPPTALISGGNQMLAETLMELHARDLRLGTDISLVSCDTIPATELHQPKIAVIRRDTVELGRRSAELLLRSLDGPTVPTTVTLATQFVPRPSCAPPPDPR
jgi:LacI family transcriptional regulator